MVTIQNEYLSVTVAKHGAELQNITGADGYEYLWWGDPTWYRNRAPIIFPICGRLPDGIFTYEGGTYSQGMHGFARHSDFTVETHTDSAVTLLLCDSEETRAVYPFAFEFRITFALYDNALRVTYDIHNPDTTPLFASFGSHEAYHCPGGLEAYDVVLPEKRTLDSHKVDLNTFLVTNNTFRVFDNQDALPATYDWFAHDSVIFKHPNLDTITLRHRETGRYITVSFTDADNLVLWSIPGAPLMCIEPWWGMAPVEGGSVEFLKKPDLHRIDGGTTHTVSHTITVGI